MEFKEIKEIAKGVIDYCYTNSPKEIIKELDISLVKEDVPGESLALFTRSPNGKEFIFLDPSCPEELENFVLAHELGHAVLHDVEIISFSPLDVPKSRLEKEADYFAFCLLGLQIERLDGYTYKDYAGIIGVNEDVLKNIYS